MSKHHVCPWWLAYTFDNPLRKLFHKPDEMFAGLVYDGMTVTDIGCGMGYFTLALAEIVGPDGKVIAIDLQQQMLDIMFRRAQKKGLDNRIVQHRVSEDTLDIQTPVDFALAFWMVHETPDPEAFFRQVKQVLKPSAKIFYTEPALHVSEKKFREILAAADTAGLKVHDEPAVRFSHAALLTLKNEGDLSP